MGIIDYLQEYNLEKRVENCAKATFMAKTKEQARSISCTPPFPYQERFEDFINR
jgi:hypothetical protein